VATELIISLGSKKHVTMAGRATLVKLVLTSIAIYCITVLNITIEVLIKIDRARRAFLWEACDEVTEEKCKVN
jgi:hypothetical protein